MPFDGLAIRAVCSELNTEYANARIDKIYQTEKDELCFTLREYRGKSSRLVLSANARWARIHKTNEKKENPTQPPAFCMLLRKHLEGGKIKEIKQLDFERIIMIRVEALDDFREWKDKILLCEFMGRHSNIILMNPETGIIIDAIKRFGGEVNSFREVYPGKLYVSPPSQGKLNPLTASFQPYYEAMWSQEGDTTLSVALFSVYSGISPFAAKQLCYLGGLDPDMPVEQCGELELSRVFDHVKQSITSIDSKYYEPTVLYSNQEPHDFCPYIPQNVSEATTYIQFQTMNECCDHFFVQKLAKIRLDNMKANVSRKVNEALVKANKRRSLQQIDLGKANDKDQYRVWGELLTAYAHQFKKGDKEAILQDFYSQDSVRIELDPRYTPIQNAQRYFKTYNKSRGAIKHLTERLQDTNAEINYLESVLVAIKTCENAHELDEIKEELGKEGLHIQTKAKGKVKDKNVRSQPRRFTSSDGLEILVGRNNRQNDWLTLRKADKNDLWLHTQDVPGTHVIISLPRTCKSINDVPDQTLEDAASLAAYYSKAAESEKVPVDYTFQFNVKKPAGAKPGMVIYDHYWTINSNPRSQDVQQLLKQLSDHTEI